MFEQLLKHLQLVQALKLLEEEVRLNGHDAIDPDELAAELATASSDAVELFNVVRHSWPFPGHPIAYADWLGKILEDTMFAIIREL